MLDKTRSLKRWARLSTSCYVKRSAMDRLRDTTSSEMGMKKVNMGEKVTNFVLTYGRLHMRSSNGTVPLLRGKMVFLLTLNLGCS